MTIEQKEKIILKVYAIIEEMTMESGSYEKEKGMELINFLEKALITK